MTDVANCTFNLNSGALYPPQYVEFDGRQIEILTNMREVVQRVATTHAHMLVPRLIDRAGSIELLKTPAGILFRGLASKTYPVEEIGYLLDLIRDEVRLQFMHARPDILWLHSAAIERNGSALLLAGPSGVGKSTLSTLLCGKGWSLMSDDIAPLPKNSDQVLSFPEEPRRRRYPGRAVDSSLINSLVRDRITITSTQIRARSATVTATVYVSFEDGAHPRLDRLTSGAAALEMLRNAINFDVRQEEAVAHAADMARRVPAYRMTYGSAENASALLDSTGSK